MSAGNLFREILLCHPTSEELAEALSLVHSAGDIPQQNWALLAIPYWRRMSLCM